MLRFTKRWSTRFVPTHEWNSATVNDAHAVLDARDIAAYAQLIAVSLQVWKRKLYRYKGNVSYDETVATYIRKQGKKDSGTGEHAVRIQERNVNNRTKICTENNVKKNRPRMMEDMHMVCFTYRKPVIVSHVTSFDGHSEKKNIPEACITIIQYV